MSNQRNSKPAQGSREKRKRSDARSARLAFSSSLPFQRRSMLVELLESRAMLAADLGMYFEFQPLPPAGAEQFELGRRVNHRSHNAAGSPEGERDQPRQTGRLGEQAADRGLRTSQRPGQQPGGQLHRVGNPPAHHRSPGHPPQAGPQANPPPAPQDSYSGIQPPGNADAGPGNPASIFGPEFLGQDSELVDVRISDSGLSRVETYAVVNHKVKPPTIQLVVIEQPLDASMRGKLAAPPQAVSQQMELADRGEAHSLSNDTAPQLTALDAQSVDLALDQASNNLATRPNTPGFRPDDSADSEDYNLNAEAEDHAFAFEPDWRNSIADLKIAAGQQGELMKLEDLLKQIAAGHDDYRDTIDTQVIRSRSGEPIALVRTYAANLQDAMIVMPVATTPLLDDVSDGELDVLTDAWTSRFGLASTADLMHAQVAGAVQSTGSHQPQSIASETNRSASQPWIASATAALGVSLIATGRFRKRTKPESTNGEDSESL